MRAKEVIAAGCSCCHSGVGPVEYQLQVGQDHGQDPRWGHKVIRSVPNTPSHQCILNLVNLMSANGNHGGRAVHTELSLNTIAVHGGPRTENERGSAVPPIYQTTTFLQRPEDIGYHAAMYHRFDGSDGQSQLPQSSLSPPLLQLSESKIGEQEQQLPKHPCEYPRC